MAAGGRVLLVLMAFSCSIYVRGQDNVTEATTESLVTTEAPLTTEPTPVDPNTDLAQCTCDLTANGCDVNCCCDPDCTEDDRLAFSQCDDAFNVVDTQACVRSDIIFVDNTPYVVNETVAGLFCVQFDNFDSRNYYRAPDILNSTELVDEYQATYGPTFSYKEAPADRTVNTDYYRSGDPVYTVYTTNALGLLGLPSAMLSEECIDTNPAAYLYNQLNECIRELDDLAVSCETTAALSAQTYYEDILVLVSPSALITEEDNSTDAVNETVTEEPPVPLYNNSLVTEIVPEGPHTCVDADGFNTTCWFGDIPPTPSYDVATGVCSNMVLKMTYTLTVNGTDGIQAVTVTFTLGNLTSDSLPLSQSFETKFVQENDNATFQRSGNPGYLVGEPVLGGYLTENTLDDGTVVLGILLDTNRDNWITMVTGTATGNCGSEPDERVSVTFGVDMRSGCTVQVFFSNMSDACEQIQEAAWNALRGPNPPDRVATFGNTPVENVGDWVEIFGVNDEPPVPSSTQTPGVCRNIITGLHMEFIYADVGSLANPQPKIIGASYRYQVQDELRFQCIGPYCQPGNENAPQKVEIVSSVGFIDASTPSTPESAEKPGVTVRLPEDFFYPFS